MVENDQSYLDFDKQLSDSLTNYKGDLRDPDFNLDYTQPSS